MYDDERGQAERSGKKKKIISQREDKDMSTSYKFQWPTMLSGLQGMTWANLPREISAGITPAILILTISPCF